jgi:hypothetical protein
LRRATRLADGWCPFAVSAEQVGVWLDRVDVGPDFEVVLGPPRPLDPTQRPEEVQQIVDDLHDAGVTMLRARFVHHSLDHYLEQLEALAALT